MDELTSQIQGFSSWRSQRVDLPVQQDDAVSFSDTWQQLTGATLLSSLATVCFLLAIALILRTIVDNGIINQNFGAFLGMGYAGVMIAYGYRRHSRERPLIPVYALCGALLLLTIVFETYVRFELLSALVAHAFLVLTLIVMTVMGLRYKVAAPLCVGVLGASMVGMALGFPDPSFPYVAVILLLANAASYAARGIPGCRWLSWAVLILTMFFWLLWATKVRTPLLSGEVLGPELALPWLLPALALFAVTYLAIFVWFVLGASGRFGFLESALVIVNVAWMYAIARAVVLPWHGREDQVGAAGTLLAFAYLSLAFWFARSRSKERQAVTTFVIAALILMAAALPASTGSILVALLAWSSLAMALTVISGIWQNPGVRATSYVLQTFACVVAAASGSFSVVAVFPRHKAAVAATLACICLMHYAWCRRKVARPEGGRVSALLFLLAMVYLFGASRMILFSTLAMSGADVGSLFECGQSILINVGALVLMLLGLFLMNAEILAVSVVVAGIGAAKVFGYDLMKIEGIPLIFSVFSFGVTASVGSLVWRGWARQTS
jgi:hypothetical protein